MVSQSSKMPSKGEQGANKSQNSNMKVVVRVRPLNNIETSSAQKSVIRVMDQNLLVFDPNVDCEAMNFPGSYKKRRNTILQRKARDLKFIFDRVFDEKSTTMEVFENTTKNIVDGVLEGYNCTVFAYGATGAGKTHTMLGNSSNPGVCFLTMMDLYSRIEEMKHEKTCDVAVSYLEVYNETIRDLLLPGPPLAVREDPQRGVCVSGLTLHKPRTAQELLGMLEFGNNNRTQHPTDANAQSSRSHAVFQVFVRQKDRTAGLQTDVRLAKMTLIDLAGSERAIVTLNRGARFREGANINKSLLALGNCINALADKENKAGHIPYRNSKLTRLLKDSLGGNCRTVMIAAISPSSLSYEDTYNTLKYADRAKSIKVKLSKNVVSVDWHVSRYAKIVEELRAEVSELKEKIKRYEEGEIVKQTPMRNAKKNEIENLKVSMRNIMNERIAIKKDVVDIEAAQRDLLFKTYKKERDLERIHLLCDEGEERDKATVKTQKGLTVTKTKKKKLETRILETEKKLQSNTQSLDRVKEEMSSLVASSQELEHDVANCQSHLKAELECAELRRQCRYFTKYTKAQEKESQATERLLTKVLSAFKRQFFLIKGAGLATPDIENQYSSIVDMVTGGREVSWADQRVLENDQVIVSNAYTINDETVVMSTNFNTPSVSTLTSILKRKSTRNSNSTPINLNSNTTPAKTVTINNDTSPNFCESRVSLLRQFEATSPDKPSRANETFTLESNASNATFDLGSNATFKFGTSQFGTPIRDAKASVTPSSKVAWMDPPTRGTPSTLSSGAGEMSISSYLPDKNTPKKTLPIEMFTPLRDLSVNKRTIENESRPTVTPNKQLKLADKSSKLHGKPMLMMPLRSSESKENVCPKTKPLRKSTSTQSLTKSDKVQRHVNGLRRVVSSTVVTGTSRKFDPRSAPIYKNMPKTMI